MNNEDFEIFQKEEGKKTSQCFCWQIAFGNEKKKPFQLKGQNGFPKHRD